MRIDEHTMRLIAVGASIAANCQPCLQLNVNKALEEGIEPQAIADAIDVGRRVRQGAATKMDAFAASLEPAASRVVNPIQGGCECSQTPVAKEG
jgi:AhpD family alkylhydroperoxidase